jgi:hypothetical protein
LVQNQGWVRFGSKFTGVIDEPMPEEFESGDQTIATLYKIGHTDDASRHPLYTIDVFKAADFLRKR